MGKSMISSTSSTVKGGKRSPGRKLTTGTCNFIRVTGYLDSSNNYARLANYLRSAITKRACSSRTFLSISSCSRLSCDFFFLLLFESHGICFLLPNVFQFGLTSLAIIGVRVKNLGVIRRIAPRYFRIDGILNFAAG